MGERYVERHVRTMHAMNSHNKRKNISSKDASMEFVNVTENDFLICSVFLCVLITELPIKSRI